MPAVQSAAGRLLLAALDEQVLAALPGLPADGEFRSRLTAVRASGFESARGEIMEGLTDLAVPLGGAGLHTRAALTITALTRDHHQFVHDALAPLQECANHIIAPPVCGRSLGRSEPMFVEHYFEDYAIGDSRASGGRTITETDIVLHAGQTGDFYPHHMDAEWCKTQPFGQRIAHGTLIFSVAVGMTAGER